MRLARNFIVIFVILAVAGLVVGKPEAVGLGNVVNFSPCDTSITYKIGTVDKRFGLSEQSFLDRTKNAAALWNDAVGQNVFAYDPQNGKITVSLLYDERQSLRSKITTLDKKLEKEKTVYEQSEAHFETRSSNFKSRLDAYKSKLDAYNNKVSDINGRGGATPEEFDEINKEKEELKAESDYLKKEADELNILAKSLNKSADFFNSQVDQLKATADTFSDTLEQKPEEGVYDPNTKAIEIYFYDNDPEFLHTLMHEFGHSRGLGHINNSKAIMYSFTSKSAQLAPDDIDAMKLACRRRNRFEYYGQEYVKRVRFLIDYYSGKVPNS